MGRLAICLAIFCYFLLIFICWTSTADELKWITDHGCCGKDDCFTVNARWIEDRGDTAVVEVNGVVLTVNSDIIKASQDQNDWWCFLPLTDGDFGDMESNEIHMQCAQGKISQECAHCIFIAVGS